MREIYVVDTDGRPEIRKQGAKTHSMKVPNTLPSQADEAVSELYHLFLLGVQLCS